MNKLATEFNFKTSDYNILVVEDTLHINKMLCETLKKLNFNCFSTETLEDGRVIVANHKIDYVLINLDLYKNYNDFIARIKDTTLKVFLLCEKIDKSFIDSAYKHGVVDFILKDKNLPYKAHQMVNTIKHLERNKSETILIIESSTKMQEKLKFMIEQQNYNIKIASNMEIAIDIFHASRIDLVLFNIELDSRGAIEFLYKHYNEIIIKKEVKILVLSGDIDAMTVRDIYASGACDIIKKPYLLEEVVLKIDLWIENKNQKKDMAYSQLLLKQYKEIVDESAIVSKVNSRGEITYANEQFCKLSGYSEDELMGNTHSIVRDPSTPASLFQDMWHTIKKKKQIWKGKIQNRAKDGSAYWVDAIIKPILDKNRNIIEYIAIRVDVTEQEKIKDYFKEELEISASSLEKSMQISEEYQRAINTSVIISRSDLQGNITYANNNFKKIFKYREKELIGSNCYLLKHENTTVKIWSKIWQVIKNGDIYKGVIQDKAKDGTSYWMNIAIVPIRDKNKKIFEYMAIRDNITEQILLQKEIEDTQKEIIYKMGEIGESRSKETGNHVKRVAYYSRLLAELYGLNNAQSRILYMASPMHDIGKVGIPDNILNKPGRLTKDEFEIMKTHAYIGGSVLKGSTREVLKAAQTVAYQHHEKWNGKGYPRGISGDNIDIFGRITALADVFDALGSDRCYKKAWSDEEIFKLFKEQRGEHFEPKLIDLFFDNLNQFLDIRDKFRD
ncbi:MAG: PAS domain S-box protein [Sulfurimonas sp.]|nr:PAS domain S-box protein [Sulfurimonas sp.]